MAVCEGEGFRPSLLGAGATFLLSRREGTSFLLHSLYMIGATGSVRGKKEFEPNSLAPESEPLLGPHLEDYWSIEDYWARSGGLLG